MRPVSGRFFIFDYSCCYITVSKSDNCKKYTVCENFSFFILNYPYLCALKGNDIVSFYDLNKGLNAAFIVPDLMEW